MCILANDAHLSKTNIFTCVSGVANDKASRQFTVYQNDIHITNPSNKENFMCLPIPLQSGLVPTEHILLYNFDHKDKGGLQKQYKDFFQMLNYNFPNQSRSLSRSAPVTDSLEVFKIGSYFCSLASSPSDVLNLDESVFGKPVGLREVLEKNYATDFAFLICKFSQTEDKELHPHPIAYSHPIAANGKLFIPTKHYHGGAPNEDFVNDWDHNIFIFNGSSDVVDSDAAAKDQRTNLSIINHMRTPMGKTEITSVLENAFKQHSNKDTLTKAFVSL